MSTAIPLTARAAVITSFDQPLLLKEDQPVVQPSELQPGQCLVKIEYAGVCHSDLHIKEGGWGPIKFPLVGGHEGIGRVVAIGEHTARSAVKIGDRVGIKWIANACLNCEMCRTGNEPNCAVGHETTHGFRVDGSFTDYAVSYVDYVTPIPENLDGAAATPLLCAGVTVFKALKESNPKLGQWVVLPGAGGGLGHLAIQYAHALGLRVIAIDTGDAKRDLCLRLGAEKWIDFKTTENIVQEIKDTTDGLGAHSAVIISAHPGSIEQAVGYVRLTGTIVIVGVPSGLATFTIPIAAMTSKCLTIRGSAVGSRQDVIDALDLAARGKVAAHYEVRPFGEINKAFDDLAAGKVGGRIIVKMLICFVLKTAGG
ncbi:Mannitol-1-phosphate dehydrogenase [Mycena indigotica]|uniref:alcohol dehydrogenase n=1 Tax=Mycena indigotica TaxID=2126181 RepID=A0A8H6TAI0_9AGAR|nr:Mannitol-1-phosphate dehydrogenase [Mycena indigotica]KAF7314923.1 Mannitol-1-phosphate dehydrogenase [Mycena indigotica]